jgi:hypothetical protein
MEETGVAVAFHDRAHLAPLLPERGTFPDEEREAVLALATF